MLKTILLHLANDPGHAARLQIACGLARRHGAALQAIFAAPEPHAPLSGRAASMAYVRETREAAEEAAISLEAEFRRRCDEEGVSGEWLLSSEEPEAGLTGASRFVDLAIVGNDEESHIESELPESLPMEISCPLLVIPARWTAAEVARRVVVAWDESRSAARAVRDALPLLTAAQSVTVLTVGPELSREDSGRRLVGFLKRHGIAAARRHDHAPSDKAGQVIQSVGDELASDLIVMGSYGHSRVRELVLGGATRHVMTHMARPVLFGH